MVRADSESETVSLLGGHDRTSGQRLEITLTAAPSVFAVTPYIVRDKPGRSAYNSEHLIIDNVSPCLQAVP